MSRPEPLRRVEKQGPELWAAATTPTVEPTPPQIERWPVLVRVALIIGLASAAWAIIFLLI